MRVMQATAGHLDELAGLFDQYRQFYEQAPDYEGCREFLRQRMANRESIIFVCCFPEDGLAGFTQLYESFCSVEMKRLIYLYDLFVAPSARGNAVARALMDAAAGYARECNAERLSLETAVDNLPARALYESLGYRKETEFFTYHLACGG